MLGMGDLSGVVNGEVCEAASTRAAICVDLRMSPMLAFSWKVSLISSHRSFPIPQINVFVLSEEEQDVIVIVSR